ncbi:hypothetical protein K439DRAFT_1360730 [Ramaria rubella]|nr:hypothetical protein K439DRAFT_1360730 [Ramaria rubella]
MRTSNTKVQVTFSAPLIFLSSDQWAQIRTSISAQFPLRDVVWKSSSRPAVRTIQALDLNLVGLDTIRDEHASQIPQTLLDKPFLNMYIVTCDDADVYKNTVRKQIKDWHVTVSQRKNQDWLILLVVRPDSRANAGGFFAMKSSVLDRIRADFNSDKRDRCVQIVWSQGVITDPARADLTLKMKEGIMSAFDSAVMQRSEEVKKSESQRQMPGWNFCTFFILKESLASSFMGMSLTDDAILTYSELEASFLHIQTSSLSGQKTISWFGKVINPDPNDDSLPLLDIGKKPYRDLILNNTISVFDFRVYLLAKHCGVLGMSGRVSEMIKKAASFLGGFGQRLKECDAPLDRFFVESWIFSSALNVVSECDKWATLSELDAVSMAAYSAAKGELLELARIQALIGHLPQSPPFSMSLSALAPVGIDSDHPDSSPRTSASQITNKDLLVVFTDREAFDKLYVDITNRAIDMYVKGGRRKFALKLHGSLAALDLHRTRHAQAYQTFTSLPAHYTPHKWTSLSTFMHGRRLDTHTHLGKPHDRDWVETALAFLKGFVEDRIHGEVGMPGETDVEEYVARLLDQIRQDAGELDRAIAVLDHPMLSLELERELAINAEDRDGYFVDVRMHNVLPCDIIVDNVCLFFTGKDSEQLEFSASLQTLLPGMSVVKLFCPNPAIGLFLLDVSEVSISTVKLQWNHRSSIALHTGSSLSKPQPSLVRLPRDYKAVDVQIEPPRCIQLDAPQSLLLTLRSGRNRILKGIIKLSNAAGIQFQTEDAETTLSGLYVEDAAVECTAESLHVSDMEKESKIQVKIPHTYHAATEALKVVVELEYHTLDPESKSPSVRHARFTRQVTTALPLMIQAHDHFRGKSVMSKFTFSTSPGTYQHIRISTTTLRAVQDEQGDLVINGCRSAKRGVTVTPTQPAHFLFRVECDAPRTTYASMHLHISYRLLREEIEGLITAHASSALQARSMPLYLSSEVKDCILKVLEKDGTWLDRYNATKELHVMGKPLPAASGIWDDERLDDIKQVTEAVVESLRVNQIGDIDEGWREVIVPVDLPFKNIVSSACILIHPNRPSETPTDVSYDSTPFYAGQPIAATLTIQSSFHWSGPVMQTAENRTYSMWFEVKEVAKDWLISGRKKGDFVVTDGSVYSVPLTLIPLRHGELSLPQVIIQPLPLTSGEMTMGSMALPSAEVYQVHGAERVLVLPRGGRTTFVVDMNKR